MSVDENWNDYTLRFQKVQRKSSLTYFPGRKKMTNTVCMNWVTEGILCDCAVWFRSSSLAGLRQDGGQMCPLGPVRWTLRRQTSPGATSLPDFEPDEGEPSGAVGTDTRVHVHMSWATRVNSLFIYLSIYFVSYAQAIKLWVRLFKLNPENRDRPKCLRATLSLKLNDQWS